ncbi:MAG: tRNA (adenosine(37)-N6)-dimethylallyltransferase MiaA [Lachnospiraceae bacterium]|nr:tRNA (adenosine(37)-N6)-dimethylallyltransferase MiaA [Lachnospiraceae bacterium]
MEPLVILTGPTAVGKTSLSLSLAKVIGGEIISADSMQVYRHMDIGTAKLPKEAMEGVPHHLIDCLSPDEPFSVAQFRQMATEAMEGVYRRGHIPILVGGTGFYIQSVLYDVSFEDEEDDGYREELERQAANGGAEELYDRLRALDPASAEAIHPNNVKRVIRALTYYHFHQAPISAHNEAQRKRQSAYNSAYFVLTRERGELYERINERVEEMFAEGLLEEVRHLTELGYDRATVAMQGLGYKELLAYFRGEATLAEAKERIKRETRHFAKRQLTWFRREKETIWFDRSERSEQDILTEMLQILRQKEILHVG